jgi:alkylation response protein AidB-like acyl-CoA dehydrogenase
LSVRTPKAPKHRGISCLLVDMKTPGITLHPYLTMMDVHHFNEVVLENVRVPRSQLLGEENRGWYIAATTLDVERSGVGSMAGYRRDLDDLIACYQEDRWRAPTWAQAAYRYQLADLTISCEVGIMLSFRVAWLQSRGMIPNYEASMIKVYASEFGQRLYNAALGILGLFGQLKPGSPWVKLRGRIERSYQWNVVMNIAAGSNEIQRNIMAARGLGLPRS